MMHHEYVNGSTNVFPVLYVSFILDPGDNIIVHDSNDTYHLLHPDCY